ncbi:MAG TPA: hypothetical protein VLA95_05730 [Gemmatimonadales bacterium]|nr:hypothetical protein [Gemmatimonadales bacterium]
MTTTGPGPGHLILDGGTLFWSESSDDRVAVLPAGGSRAALAHRIGVPEGIAVEGGTVYWLDDRMEGICTPASKNRRLVRTPAGGGATELASAANCGLAPGDLVLAGGDAFWIGATTSPETFTIYRTPAAGGASTVVWTATMHVAAMLADGGYLYWLENTYPNPEPAMAIRRVPLAGGAVEPVVEDLQTWGRTFAVRGTSLFLSVVSGGSEEMVEIPLAGGPPTPLATLPRTPRKLVVDETALYWIDDVAVASVPRGGGTPTELWSNGRAPLDLLLQDGSLTWTETTGPAHGETGAVRTMPAEGGTAAVISEGGDAPRRVAADANGVYWTEGGFIGNIEGFGRIAHAPAGGGPVVTLASGVAAASPPIAVNASHVFIADKFRIERVPRGGGLPETVAAADFSVTSLVADATHVYWVEEPFAHVYRAPVGGGEPELLGTTGVHNGPGGPIRLRNGSVYWMSHYSAILRVPASGGPVQVIASGLPFLSDFVVDDAFLYYSENDTGLIKRMPLEGGDATTLAIGLAASYNVLAESGADLYWLDQTWLQVVPKSGGEPRPLSEPVAPSVLLRPAIALDAASVYWTEVLYEGIVKAPR